jgi:hypothetical protein
LSAAHPPSRSRHASIRTSNPARSNTVSIAWFEVSTSASKRWIRRSAAIEASCSSILVAVPRRWKSSATANAASATPGSRGTADA